jgi:hypothetical protein
VKSYNGDSIGEGDTPLWLPVMEPILVWKTPCSWWLLLLGKPREPLRGLCLIVPEGVKGTKPSAAPGTVTELFLPGQIALCQEVKGQQSLKDPKFTVICLFYDQDPLGFTNTIRQIFFFFGITGV